MKLISKFFIIVFIFFSSDFLIAQTRRTYSEARIDQIFNFNTLMGVSEDTNFKVGETLGVQSQDKGVGLIGFVEIVNVKNLDGGRQEIKCRLLRQSKNKIIQWGDRLVQLNLYSLEPLYEGTTDLIVKKGEEHISSRYKPLFTQGLNIGETAQSLWRKESIVTFYGLYYYGINDQLSIGLFLPQYLVNSYNWTTKYKFYESDSNVLSTGVTYAQIPGTNSKSLNANFYWDSLSSDTTISHLYLSLAMVSWDGALDVTAIKALGTSSFQTGYEIILKNWDRVLIGPNYNFEKKTLGGYITYMQIWDRFHMNFGLSSTNIAQLTVDPKNGYYFFLDAYWRF